MKKIILEKNTAEIIIKKSRFIGEIFPCESETEAKEIINQVRKTYYDARHVCYAYIILDPLKDINSDLDIMKYSDDGEPQGTAGKPILDILKLKKITNALICVTRYFGGILLGANGLTHAYKDAANECSNKCKLYEILQGKIIKININYTSIGILKKYEEQVKNKIFNLEELYSENVDIKYLVLQDFEKDFISTITNLTKGIIKINTTDDICNFILLDNKKIILMKH